VESFEFKDFAVNLQSMSPRYYYKIETVNTLTGQSTFTEPRMALLNTTPDNVALAVQEQYKIYLDGVIDNPFIFIFLRKRFGRKCPVCWDDIRLQSKSDNCKSCYNTGYAGGYSKPVMDKYCAMSPDGGMQMAEDLFDAGERQAPLQIWIGNHPIIHPGDVLADINNRRYRVTQVQQTSKSGFILRQILVIERIPFSDITYNLLF